MEAVDGEPAKKTTLEGEGHKKISRYPPEEGNGDKREQP
jgi:hypothetical protein